MDEYTYYMDSDAFVTNRRVRLGPFEYDLADIRWAGVEERLVGIRIGPFDVQSNISILILTYLLVMALGMFLLIVLPGNAKMIALSMILIAGWVMHGLMRWLGRRGHRQFWLGVSGTFGTHYAMASVDELHLKRTAEAIKRAMRDRYASLHEADSARVGRRRGMPTQ